MSLAFDYGVGESVLGLTLAVTSLLAALLYSLLVEASQMAGLALEITGLLGVEVLGASLAYYLKAKDLRFVQVNLGRLLYHCLIPGQENLRERGAEVRSVKIRSCVDPRRHAVLSWKVLLHHVDLVAFRTEDFHSAVPQFVAESDGETLLVIAEGSGTVPKHSFDVFSEDFRLPLWRPNVPIMDQAVDVNCVLNELQVPFILQVFLRRGC